MNNKPPIPIIRPSYQTLGEICTRLTCGRKRVKRLIQEGLPAICVAGQYMMTEKKYLEWLDRVITRPQDP